MNETQVIDSLSKLGFPEDCIVETIMVTMNENGTPNPAPMGVARCGGGLFVTPFKTSTTYENLKRGGLVHINITDDPQLFLDTAFKDEVDDQPVTNDGYVEGADAVIKAEIVGKSKEYEFKSDYKLKPVNIVIKSRHPYVFSRGRAEAIEAIIHATRIQVFHEESLDEKVRDLVDHVKDCISIIKKVSPEESTEVQVTSTLKALITQWGVEW